MRLRYPTAGTKVLLTREQRLHGVILGKGALGVVADPPRWGDEIAVNFTTSLEMCDPDEVMPIPEPSKP